MKRKIKTVLDHYGSVADMSYQLRVTTQAIYKCISSEDGLFTPRIAIAIERDTGGKFKAIDIAGE